VLVKKALVVIVILAVAAVVAVLAWPKNGGDGGKEVVVYTALDRGFSEPLLKKFEEKTGIKVRPKYDEEATKTVGLTNAIRAEKARPQCDVFWNNEILNTLRLKKDGLLAEFRPKAAADIPATFRDPEGYWTGFAARARVIIVNTDLVKPGEEPDSVNSLADPKWKGKVGIAKPLFGTTASHAAVFFAMLGETKAKAYFESLKANEVRIQSGNKSCALDVSAGRLAFGMTDTDDAIIEVESGKPVKIVYPDAKPDQMGVLFIPNTLSLIKDCPHPEAGKKLIEYLLSPEVEEALAKCPSAQIPLNPKVTVKTRVKTPKEVKAMPVNFAKAAESFDKAAKYIEGTFLK
jgi:iron(III) transport system substrate-binding protein